MGAEIVRTCLVGQAVIFVVWNSRPRLFGPPTHSGGYISYLTEPV